LVGFHPISAKQDREKSCSPTQPAYMNRTITPSPSINPQPG
jgi:hypothetical protein